MSSREFWAAEAAKMRDTSALFDVSHLVTDNRKTGSNSNSVVKEYFFTANIVNESSMTVDQISESVQYAQDIYFRNKISISFRLNIMSKKDALLRKTFSKHSSRVFSSAFGESKRRRLRKSYRRDELLWAAQKRFR